MYLRCVLAFGVNCATAFSMACALLIFNEHRLTPTDKIFEFVAFGMHTLAGSFCAMASEQIAGGCTVQFLSHQAISVSLISLGSENRGTESFLIAWAIYFAASVVSASLMAEELTRCKARRRRPPVPTGIAVDAPVRAHEIQET